MMKKLLLVAAFGFAGLMSASNGTPNALTKTNDLKLKKLFNVTYRVYVTTSCGTTHSYDYYFNFNPTQADFDNILKSWKLIDCDDNSNSGSVKRAKVLSPIIS